MSKLVSQTLQHLGVLQQKALLSKVRKLLEVVSSTHKSEWVSPMVVRPKKNGKWCMCVDYKPLNSATKRDHFPLPFQDELLDEIRGYECVMAIMAISKFGLLKRTN